MSIGGEQNEGQGAQLGDHAREWLQGATPLDLAQPAGEGEAVAHDRLAFDHADRLPWLEGDDDEDYAGVDSKRVIAAVLGGLAVLAALVGGMWYFTHRGASGAPAADGSTIAAPAEPMKEAPKDAGGKQFEGTGDSSFAVSQGQSRPAHLAGAAEGAAKEGASAAEHAAANAAEVASSTAAAAGASYAGGAAASPVGKPTAKPAAVAAAPRAAPAPAATEASGPAGGVVQIAAYSSEALAQAGWNRLVTTHEMLKGQNHRIVSAKVDMGTVWRLQLVTGTGGGAALCERLKADSLPCQVKH